MKTLMCFVVEKIIALQFVVKVVKVVSVLVQLKNQRPRKGLYMSAYPEYSISTGSWRCVTNETS